MHAPDLEKEKEEKKKIHANIGLECLEFLIRS